MHSAARTNGEECAFFGRISANCKRVKWVRHTIKRVGAAKSTGVRADIDFAIFQTYGYKGLYGGLNVPKMRGKDMANTQCFNAGCCVREAIKKRGIKISETLPGAENSNAGKTKK